MLSFHFGFDQLREGVFTLSKGQDDILIQVVNIGLVCGKWVVAFTCGLVL